jgi:hypothetical protein
MKINCATSSRNVMLFIQRRTVGEVLGALAGLAAGAVLRGAAGAAAPAADNARNTQIKPG